MEFRSECVLESKPFLISNYNSRIITDSLGEDKCFINTSTDEVYFI